MATKKDNNSSLIRISNDLKIDLENLEIKTWWVKLSWMDQIITHLLWYYKHYQNNNWKD